MDLTLTVNGQPRTFPGLGGTATLAQVIAAMELKADRVAVEHNGEIAPRAGWDQVVVTDGDRMEVVHFVGGGAA